MSTAKPQQEPSMEEILASIRRIISEEGEAPQAETAAAGPGPGAAEAVGEPEEDVLNLTRMVRDDGTVVNLLDEAAGREEEAQPEAAAEPEPGPEAAPAEAAAPEPEPAPEPEVEAMPEPEPEPEPVPEPEPEPEPEIEAEAMAEPEPEPEPEPERETEGELELEEVEPAQPMPAAAAERAAEEPLVSKEAADMSTAALAVLARAVAQQNVRVTGQTLEDLTKEILRPLLREWLNENLPALIERLVRVEIEKMVGRVKDR
jgi:cell pole-organizing protein PopZ